MEGICHCRFLPAVGPCVLYICTMSDLLVYMGQILAVLQTYMMSRLCCLQKQHSNY